MTSKNAGMKYRCLDISVNTIGPEKWQHWPITVHDRYHNFFCRCADIHLAVVNQSRDERNQNEMNKLLTLPNKVFSFGLISLAHNSFIGIEKSTMKGTSLMIQ